MLERVKKYQRAIEENDGSMFVDGDSKSIKSSELSRPVIKP
jgi:hypothetical protein